MNIRSLFSRVQPTRRVMTGAVGAAVVVAVALIAGAVVRLGAVPAARIVKPAPLGWVLPTAPDPKAEVPPARAAPPYDVGELRTMFVDPSRSTPARGSTPARDDRPLNV